jgi:hypothetical protein
VCGGSGADAAAPVDSLSKVRGRRSICHGALGGVLAFEKVIGGRYLKKAILVRERSKAG